MTPARLAARSTWPAAPHAWLAALACAAALTTAGCTHRFPAFPFAAADGHSIDLLEPAGSPAGPAFSAGQASLPVYRLASPVIVPEGQAFALTYDADTAGSTLEIYADRSTVERTASLPATGDNAVRLVVALDKGARVWGFRVTPPATGSGSIRLRGAGTTVMVHGFTYHPGLLTVDGSLEVSAVSDHGASVRIPAATRGGMAGEQWLLSVDYESAGQDGMIDIRSADGGHAAFTLDSRASQGRIWFSMAALGFLPGSVTASGSVAGMQVVAVPDGAPIPADPGVILAGVPSRWRRPEFELYSWDRYPRVLILDTRTYAVQDDLFKRLAFFVEKPGFAGRVLTDEELRGKHGWNAHDYKPDDLARFFTAAARGSVALTGLEEVLRGILEENGIIRKVSAGGWEAGDGAVISISQSSDPVLRELLLTHEAFHGVYFSLPGLRNATEGIWNGLLPEEQDAWKEFLSSQDYDTSDKYLLVNEFQAYLLQQERAAVPGRQALILSRMKTGSTRGARIAAALRAAAPDSFLRSFDALQAALQAEGGPVGGVIVGVRAASKR